MCAEKVFLLKCSVQNYAWGKLGQDSEVARLAKSFDKHFQIDGSIPYAELWMGTHPKGPSVTVPTGELLSKWIADHPESLGSKARCLVTDSVGQLPFLLKVLSVNKSLSIQVHPNKEEAERLHRENPGEYPDSNHKPEMAIALTPFEALCGFRPKQEIAQFLSCIPELRSVVGASAADEFLAAFGPEEEGSMLKKCFSALMSSPVELIKEQLSRLVSRVQEAKARHDSETAELCLGDLLLRLHDEFPGDVGCFAIYFLNFIKLKIGEALFLEADLPHAYLYGDCLECMACSDNVVRAGLTPKFKDVATLCSLLKYNCKSATDVLFNGHRSQSDPHLMDFNPPVKDFSVHLIQIQSDVVDYDLKPVDGASILIVIDGATDVTSSDGTSLKLERGSVLFISANASARLQISSSHKQLLMYRAFCDGSE